MRDRFGIDDDRSTFVKDEPSSAEFDFIAVGEDAFAGQLRSVDARSGFGVAVTKSVSRGGYDNFGVSPRDLRIAEKAHVGALVEADRRRPIREQKDSTLLATRENLQPGSSQGLLDKSEEEPQTRSQDDDSESLARRVSESFGERDAERFK